MNKTSNEIYDIDFKSNDFLVIEKDSIRAGPVTDSKSNKSTSQIRNKILNNVFKS